MLDKDYKLGDINIPKTTAKSNHVQKSIVLFASGNGSNAAKIIDELHPDEAIVKRIYCNNADAGVVEKAKIRGIDICVFNKSDWQLKEQSHWFAQLQADAPDLIVLAGFLWKIPVFMISAFENSIINLHPSLLPKYGGKGMYGLHVHEAVLKAKEETTGITFHFVNSQYDEGGIIAQFEIYVAPSKTPEHLAQRIHKLEHEYFSKVILSLINQ